jgi:hypothetical protein
MDGLSYSGSDLIRRRRYGCSGGTVEGDKESGSWLSVIFGGVGVDDCSEPLLGLGLVDGSGESSGVGCNASQCINACSYRSFSVI